MVAEMFSIFATVLVKKLNMCLYLACCHTVKVMVAVCSKLMYILDG